MVSIRFYSSLLGVMFIFLAVRDSVAYNHKATEKMVVADGNAFVAAGVSPQTLEKEHFDAAGTAAEAKSGKLGGRRMMDKRVLGKEMVKEYGMNGGVPKISGRNMNMSKKPLGNSEAHMHDQNEASMLKPMPMGSERQETSGKGPFDLQNTNQPCSKDSEAVPTGERVACSTRSMPLASKGSVNSYQNLQSQKFLHEATTEIENLMNKDYSGAGTPPHKPPINNDEPLQQENEIP